MEIEIHTTTGIWITDVDDQPPAHQELGAAARGVGDRIRAGELIEVRRPAMSAERPYVHRVQQMAIINPGHVVAVVEIGRARPARRVPRPGRA